MIKQIVSKVLVVVLLVSVAAPSPVKAGAPGDYRGLEIAFKVGAPLAAVGAVAIIGAAGYAVVKKPEKAVPALAGAGLGALVMYGIWKASSSR